MLGAGAVSHSSSSSTRRLDRASRSDPDESEAASVRAYRWCVGLVVVRPLGLWSMEDEWRLRGS